MTNQRSIALSVSHPSNEPGRIQGFRYIWAYYVESYKPETHCQPCFIGSRVPEFSTPTAMSERRYEFDRMDRYPYLYLCGVGAGPKRDRRMKNLHLPLEYAEGGIEEATTYNGYHFRVENARLVSVPELPETWEGKERDHVRCKNFQFAVACFGYPPRALTA